jgi:hypothetical protein
MAGRCGHEARPGARGPVTSPPMEWNVVDHRDAQVPMLWLFSTPVDNVVNPLQREAVHRIILSECVSGGPTGYRNTDGEAVDDWDQMDVVAPIGSPFDGGIGMGRHGDGRRLRTSDLLAVMLADVEVRLSAV